MSQFHCGRWGVTDGQWLPPGAWTACRDPEPIVADGAEVIVGGSIGDRMKARLAVRALDNAAARRGADGRPVAGCILHSDRGSQPGSRKMQRALTRHSMIGSIGQVGAAGDTGAMESFFALLQKNVLDRRSWRTRDELRIAIVTWIERTYHRRRRQATLGRLTPVEYETIMTQTATQAA